MCAADVQERMTDSRGTSGPMTAGRVVRHSVIQHTGRDSICVPRTAPVVDQIQVERAMIRSLLSQLLRDATLSLFHSVVIRDTATHERDNYSSHES